MSKNGNNKSESKMEATEIQKTHKTDKTKINAIG